MNSIPIKMTSVGSTVISLKWVKQHDLPEIIDLILSLKKMNPHTNLHNLDIHSLILLS